MSRMGMAALYRKAALQRRSRTQSLLVFAAKFGGDRAQPGLGRESVSVDGEHEQDPCHSRL